MKETISKDAARMERLSWASMLLLIIGSVSMIVFVSALDSRMILPRVSDGVLAGFTSFFIFAVLAMICAVHIEKIKAAHNLVSYHEISAFMDGEEVSADKSALGRKHPPAQQCAQVCMWCRFRFYRRVRAHGYRN